MRRILLLALLAAGCAGHPESLPDGGAAGDARASLDAAEPRPDASADAGPGPDAGPADTGAPAVEISQFWANTQWPAYQTLAPGAKGSAYGQVWISGGTDAPGAMAGLSAQLGVGALGSEPSTWSWTDAAFNVAAGNNDEFKGELVAPSAPGIYEYAFRYAVGGAVFKDVGGLLYGGLKGPLRPGEAAQLAVRGAGAKVRVATQNLHCQNNDPKARFAALVSRWAALGVDVVALQEVCVDPSTGVGNSAEYLAAALQAATGRAWRWTWLETHLANGSTPEGIGLLSAYPIPAQATRDLVSNELGRKALIAAIGTPVGALAVAVVHLSYRSEDAAVRVQQAQAILGLVDEWQKGAGRPAGTAALVAGDFNDVPGSDPLQVFTGASAGFVDAWAERNPGAPGLSHPSWAPTRRIDYLLVRPAAGLPLAVLESTEEFLQPYAGSSYPSDHAGFTATLSVP